MADRAKAGVWRKTLEGYRAFFPCPLPPEIEWSAQLISKLSRADHLLGRLGGEARRLPNPHIFLRPFVRREAVYSSRIEGTQATLGELLAAEAGAHVDRSPDDLREVGNYVAALEHGMKRLPELSLSVRLVKEMHGILMTGVRGEHATPGEFRRTQNWIGAPGCALREATFVPPPPETLLEHLGAWENFLHDSDLPPLISAALMHYQFEAIHPFLDGNGRIGRLLITLLLCERDILPGPFLYLSAFIEATRRDYYDLLLAVSNEGAWEPWLMYFLNAVIRQSEDLLGRAERMNATMEMWKNEVRGISPKATFDVVGLLAENPFITARKAEAALSVSYNTVNRSLAALEKGGILERAGASKRDRVYCATSLLKILDEPARLTG